MLSSLAMVGKATLAILASNTEPIMASSKTAAAGIIHARGKPSGSLSGSLALWFAPLGLPLCPLLASLFGALAGVCAADVLCGCMGSRSGALDITGSIDSAQGPEADEDAVSVLCN